MRPVCYVDVFHGDADGLCAVHQLRLARPVPPGAPHQIVTGLKDDVELLARVRGAPGCIVTVLDVSLDRNRAALLRVLDEGAEVQYIDHQFAGAVPRHPRLQARIDTAADVCASILVDALVGGAHRAWAVVGAFGDNLESAAAALAAPLALGAAQIATLRRLGEDLNYNAYGDSLDDVLLAPDALYRAMQAHADPLAFAATGLVERLTARRRSDLAAACTLAPLRVDADRAVYRLPAQPWSGRVIGTFANALARTHPRRAHAVLAPRADGSVRVSVRSPLIALGGADELCRQFPLGGGRPAAAGIPSLAAADVASFLAAFHRMSWTDARARSRHDACATEEGSG